MTLLYIRVYTKSMAFTRFIISLHVENQRFRRKSQLLQGFSAFHAVVNRIDNCVNRIDNVANILEKSRKS